MISMKQLCVSFILFSRQKLAAANDIWSNLTAATVGERDYTASLETSCRHALKNHSKHLQAVQMLERKMNI